MTSTFRSKTHEKLPFSSNEILVLITTFNRPEAVTSILSDLKKSRHSGKMRVAVGNSGSIPIRFPSESFSSLTEFKLASDLYWAGGMSALANLHQGWQGDVLWLNEDVRLDVPTFDQSLCRSEGNFNVYYGVFGDSSKGVTYGGWVRKGVFGSELLSNKDFGITADFANGNCIYIPSCLIGQLPIFPSGFKHGFADFALSSIAKKLGIPLISLGEIGACERQIGIVEQSLASPTISNLKRALGPKGLQVRDYFRWRNIDHVCVIAFALAWFTLAKFLIQWMIRRLKVVS